MAIKKVAEKLSPASNNSLMCASFTPRMTKLKPFNIPKNLLPNTLRVSPTDAWHRENFPAPAYKQKFVIGCVNDPKVTYNLNDKENINPITNLQAARSEPGASNATDSHNPVVNKVKELGKLAIFQTMEHETPEEAMEEVDIEMLSPGAREAMEKRRGPQARDNSQDFPSQAEAQQGNPPHEGGGPAQGGTDGPNGTDTTNASTSLRDNKSLRTALENLMKVHEIMLQAPFIQQLDQIILAGQSGKEFLLDMITTASTGEDPAPEGDFDHPPTQGEIIELAKRLSEAKAANNNAESIRQETERK